MSKRFLASLLLAHSHGYLDLEGIACVLIGFKLIEAPVMHLRFDNIAHFYRHGVTIHKILEQRRSMSCETLTGSEINDREAYSVD